jgi:hypothetical protein
MQIGDALHPWVLPIRIARPKVDQLRDDHARILARDRRRGPIACPEPIAAVTTGAGGEDLLSGPLLRFRMLIAVLRLLGAIAGAGRGYDETDRGQESQEALKSKRDLYR